MHTSRCTRINVLKFHMAFILELYALGTYGVLYINNKAKDTQTYKLFRLFRLLRSWVVSMLRRNSMALRP